MNVEIFTELYLRTREVLTRLCSLVLKRPIPLTWEYHTILEILLQHNNHRRIKLKQAKYQFASTPINC